LQSNQLNGPVPPELGELTNLLFLFLYDNQLSGSIPPELSKLTNLWYLYLQTNQLSGPIPQELGKLTDLPYLSLGRNQLSGPIPPELFKLTNLQLLFLQDNQLSGPIPKEFGELTNLQVLWLGNNQLSGPIPPELGKLTKLQNLSLMGNPLSGPIPPELGKLTNLERLSLSGSQLSGPIPPELGKLTKLQYLYLNSNQLSGPIPAALGALTNLERLSLDFNHLSGAIPPELGQLTNMQYLYLNFNQLTGSIPPELGEMTNLLWLFLDSNQLIGPIPPQLGDLINLQYLYLDTNQLSGRLPPELSKLTNLQHLYLNSNQLNGPIPPEIGGLTNLGFSGSDFRWNGLMTPDAELNAFLDSKQRSGNNWSATQTMAPLNLVVEEVGSDSVTLAWQPIEYRGNTGRYRAWYSQSPGGPYSDGGTTPNKFASKHIVTGLEQSTTYYFVVRTETDAHFSNPNFLVSEPSLEVSTTTTAETFSCSYALTSPIGGEHWQRGTTQQLAWQSSGGGCSSSVQLDLYKGGNLDHTITTTGNNGTYSWGIQSDQEEGADYRIRVTDVDNNSYGAESPSVFAISGVPPQGSASCTYRVTTPGIEDIWQRGTSYDIHWNFTSSGAVNTCSSSVDITLRKNGFYYSTIASKAQNDRTYNWQIPADHETGDQWSIRVTDFSHSDLGHESARFGIAGVGTPYDLQKDFAIDSRVSGAWYGGPSESGHGWFIEVLDIGGGDQLLAVYWYVYHQGKQVWLLGTGPVVGNTARVNTFITLGPDFPPDFDTGDFVEQEWGELEFIFDNEVSGSVSWASAPVETFNGAMDIQRFAPILFSGNHCQSGSWYNTGESGHGFVSEVIASNGREVLVLVWYTYLDGEQKWILGNGPLIDGRADVEMSIFSGAEFPPDFNTDTVVEEPWGTVSFEYTGASSAIASWTTDYPGYSSGSMTLQRLTELSGHNCQ